MSEFWGWGNIAFLKFSLIFSLKREEGHRARKQFSVHIGDGDIGLKTLMMSSQIMKKATRILRISPSPPESRSRNAVGFFFLSAAEKTDITYGGEERFEVFSWLFS